MRVTSKGQVTIPKHFRQRTGMEPGADVEFVEREGELVLRKAGQPRRRDADAALEAYLDEVAGTLDLGMTTDEYMELLRGE